jgi:hypothetical protein
MSVVLRNPGIPGPLLLAQLDAISPAAAQQVLDVLVAGQHLIVRHVPVAGAADAGREQPALKLGVALSSCLVGRAAQPPSLLLGGSRQRPAAAAAPGSSSGGVSGEGGQRMAHFWPSLTSSSTCHLTAPPPCQAASAAPDAAAAS